MSAIGIASPCISAHADFRHSDFHFPRTQSLTLRDAPWGRRLKPLRSWSEIGAYGAVALAATVLLSACV